METFAEMIKKVPALCWGVLCLCLLAYTGTLCVVMLRSSEVNVTINGMTMEMTKAASTQDGAAADLEAAAKTIEALKAQIAVYKAKEESPLAVLTRPAPAALPAPQIQQQQVQARIPMEIPPEDFRGKASKLREHAADMQQKAERAQPGIKQ